MDLGDGDSKVILICGTLVHVICDQFAHLLYET